MKAPADKFRLLRSQAGLLVVDIQERLCAAMDPRAGADGSADASGDPGSPCPRPADRLHRAIFKRARPDDPRAERAARWGAPGGKTELQLRVAGGCLRPEAKPDPDRRDGDARLRVSKHARSDGAGL